mgnify:FL=1
MQIPCLSAGRSNFKMKTQNSKLFKQRMRKAKQWARIIAQNSNVVMVAMTGSMATGNATKKSDIDFFIQVSPNQIWSARFFIMLKLKLADEQPERYARAGKICLNWWADFNAPQKSHTKHIVLFQRTADQKISQPDFFEKFCRWVQIWRLKLEKKKGNTLIRISNRELRLRHKLDYNTLD